MNKLLFFLTFIFYASLGFGQIVLFEESFENSVAGWNSYGDLTPNFWISDVCAGNGPTNSGQVSMYITAGGTTPGCGTGGTINYGYVNSDNGGSKSITTAYLIEATCASDLHISFDQELNTDNIGDYAELVYSTDNGATWTAIGSHLTPGATWQTVNTNLPASLDYSDFLLGFRFTYNETTIGMNPLAVDNIIITGTDSEDPTVVCPPNQNTYTNTSCQATVGNYVSLAVATDNCASGSDFTFTQNPPAGTVISTNTAIQIIVEDMAGNTGTCSFTALALDTLKPQITCVESMIIPVNSACEFSVPNLASTVVVTDNCTSAPNFTITQNPLAGSTATGVTDVFLTVTDQAGNSSICGTRLFPDDQIAPVITCPNDVTISNGVACSYVMTNYIPAATIVESCPHYNVYQNPPAGATLGTGQHDVVITVTDVMNNSASCTFHLDIIETVPPVITFCPNSVSSCNPVVSFADITASDNCGNVLITQTAGLASGSTFPVGITNMEFTAADSSGNTDVCNFTIEVYEFPGAASVIEDTISLCAVNTTTIAATPVVAGAGTGAWSQIAGTANIANPSQASTSVTDLSTGLNTFVWTVSTAHCGTNRDTVFVTVYQQPTIADVQTDTTYACSAQSSLLLGNFPTIGTAHWTTAQGANIVNPNQHNTAVNSPAPGWNDFVYTISNGSCPSSSDTLSIYFNNSAGAITQDTTICRESGPFTVTGSTPASGQNAAWYFIQGEGNLLAPNSTTSVIEDIAAGTNKLVYRLSHPVCGFSYDTIAIVVTGCNGGEFSFPTVITPNFDGKNDLFVVDNLDELYPACEVTIVNRWGTVVYESKGYKNPWNGTFKNEDLPMGTYYYKVALNDSKKTVFSGPISIIR